MWNVRGHVPLQTGEFLEESVYPASSRESYEFSRAATFQLSTGPREKPRAVTQNVAAMKSTKS